MDGNQPWTLAGLASGRFRPTPTTINTNHGNPCQSPRTCRYSDKARNTAFTYRGKSVDAKEIGKELGVRYPPVLC